MDFIPYINDLLIEIDTLKKLCNGANEVNEKIINKEKIINECKNNLSKLSSNSIECRIYLKILNGKSPTQAVSEVADENFANDIKPNSVTQIWKYYKNLKKIIKL